MIKDIFEIDIQLRGISEQYFPDNTEILGVRISGDYDSGYRLFLQCIGTAYSARSIYRRFEVYCNYDKISQGARYIGSVEYAGEWLHVFELLEG